MIRETPQAQDSPHPFPAFSMAQFVSRASMEADFFQQLSGLICDSTLAIPRVPYSELPCRDF